MPADAGAGRVFVDEDLLQRLGGDASEGGDPHAQRQKEGRDGVARAQVLGSIVVAPAEGDDTPVAEKAVKRERFERQGLELRNERLLLGRRSDIVLIGEALGKGRRRGEEVGLVGRTELTTARQ
jgi:hypothetical protein